MTALILVFTKQAMNAQGEHKWERGRRGGNGHGREEGEEGTAMGERKEDCTKGGGTGDREGEGKCHRRDTEGEKQERRGQTL